MACFKVHKPACTPKDSGKESSQVEQTPEKGEQEAKEPVSDGSGYEKLINDDIIKSMLRYPALKVHLNTVYTLLTDSQVSGEMTDDGRRTVALKKLRELRKGGREENELVEDFITRILHLDPSEE